MARKSRKSQFDGKRGAETLGDIERLAVHAVVQEGRHGGDVASADKHLREVQAWLAARPTLKKAF